MNNQIAQIILEQIGHKALYMIGASNKHITAIKNGVILRIGRNSKRINRVVIRLNNLDLYDIEFLYQYNNNIKHTIETKLINKESGLYHDQLRESIEHNTGLYTHL